MPYLVMLIFKLTNEVVVEFEERNVNGVHYCGHRKNCKIIF